MEQLELNLKPTWMSVLQMIAHPLHSTNPKKTICLIILSMLKHIEERNDMFPTILTTLCLYKPEYPMIKDTKVYISMP